MGEIIVKIICSFIDVVAFIVGFLLNFLLNYLPLIAVSTICYGWLHHDGLYLSFGFLSIVMNIIILFYFFKKNDKSYHWVNYFAMLSALLLCYTFLSYFWKVNKGVLATKEEFEILYSAIKYFCAVGSIFVLTQHFFNTNTPK